MIVKIILFQFWISISNSLGCLVQNSTDKNSAGCLICQPEYFFDSDNSLCSKRILSDDNIKRLIGITGNEKHPLPVYKNFNAIYDDFEIAMESEEMIAKKINANSYKINFQFLKGDHYFLGQDLSKNSIKHLFSREPVDLVFQPFYCRNETDEDKESCYEKGELVRIYVKTLAVSIHIVKSVSFENMVFDGRDLASLILNTSCANSKEICCEKYFLNCNAFNIGFNQSSPEREIFGLFVIEPLFDDSSILSHPEVLLKNIIFDKMNALFGEYTLEGKALTLIFMDDLEGSIKMNNCSVLDSYFSRGIVHKLAGINSKYTNLNLVYNNIVANKTIIRSTIEIEMLSVYNYISIFDSNLNKDLIYANSLFRLNNFQGSLTLIGAYYFNCSLPNSSFLFIENIVSGLLTVFIIEGQTFNKSIFSNFLSATDCQESTGTRIFLKNNDFPSSLFQFFIILKSIQYFQLTGNFTKEFIFPSLSFIETSYSNISILNCIFADLKVPRDGSTIIRINSDYSYTFELVFTVAKRKASVKYANDSTIIKGCIFLRSDFLLFAIKKLNYQLIIEDNYFENISTLIHNDKSFINCVTESRFIVNQSIFKNFELSGKVILVTSFLNASLENLYFKVIKSKSPLIHFRSLTVADPSEHQLIIRNLLLTNIFIANSAMNMRLFILFIDYYESGKGAYVYLGDSSFNNVSITFNQASNLKNCLLYSWSSSLEVSNLTSKNVSGFIIISNEASIVDATLILKNLKVNNLLDFPIISVLADGIVGYSRAELINSSFINICAIDNFAMAFTSVARVSISNLELSIKQARGSILYIFVQNLANFQLINTTVASISGSWASLLTFATEKLAKIFNWTDIDNIELKLATPSITYSENETGIIRCTFQGSNGGAINLLQQTELFISDSKFMDLNAREGPFLVMITGSKAILFRCNVSNTYSSGLGGAIAAESSILIVIGVLFNTSFSDFKGGVISVVDCDLYLKSCALSNGRSILGGLVFADDTRVTILSSRFTNGSALSQGGHLATKKGFLNIRNSIFEAGFVENLGGSFYLEGTLFDISEIEIKSCTAKVGIIYLSSSLENTSKMKNLRMISNIVKQTGGCLYLVDFLLSFNRSELIKNQVEEGYLFELKGTFEHVNISLEHTILKDNVLKKGVFLNDEIDLSLTFFVLFNNIIYSQNIIRARKSKIIVEYFHSQLNLLLENQRAFAILGHIVVLKIGSSFFNGSANNLICIECPSVTIDSSKFTNSFGNEGGCVNLKKSAGYFIHVIFEYNYANIGSAIHTFDSTIMVNMTYFYKNQAIIMGSDIVIISSSTEKYQAFEISSCFFSNVAYNSIHIEGAVSNIHNTVFKGSLDKKAQAIKIMNFGDIRLESCKFFEFSNSSVISIEGMGRNKITLTINYALFNKSLNLQSPGGFLSLSGWINGSIKNTIFDNGCALKGGAIYIASPSSTLNQLKIANTSFYNNVGLKLGGAISSESLNVYKNNNDFHNNRAFVGNNTNFFPTKLVLFQKTIESSFDFENIALCEEGQKCLKESLSLVPGRVFSLGVIILDEENNIQRDQSDFYVKLEADHCSSTLPESYKFTFLNNQARVKSGLANFEALVLVGPTNRTFKACLIYSNERNVVKKNLSINVLKCSRGDSYQDNICTPCGENFYSLAENPESNGYACLPCPPNAICPGGDIVIPAKDFWRKDAFTSLISPCKYKTGCLDQSLFEESRTIDFVFRCGEGFEGNLCETCKKGYILVKNNCIKCDESGQFLTVIMMLSGFLIYLLYVIYEEKQSLDTSDENSVTLLKILVNHLSINIILTAMKVNWSEFFLDFLSISSIYASTSPTTIFSFECLFMWSPEERLENRILMAGFAPFVLVFFTILLNIKLLVFKIVYKSLIKNKARRFTINENITQLKLNLSISFLFSESVKHLLIIFLNIYPQVLVIMFSVVGCKKIDDSNEKYLTQHPWVACYSSFHKKLGIVSMTFLIFWGIFIPIVLSGIVLNLHSKKSIVPIKFDKQFDNKKKRSNYSINNKEIILNFLIKGYKKKFFWWDFTVFLRKSLLICLVAFSEEMDAVSVGGLAILFLSCFLLLTLFKDPYKTKVMNLLEVNSLLISISSIGFGIISNNGSILNPILRYTIYFLLVFSNIAILLIIIYLYFSTVFGEFLLKILALFKLKRQKRAPTCK